MGTNDGKRGLCFSCTKLAFMALCLLAIIGSIIIAVINLMRIDVKAEKDIVLLITSMTVLNVFLHLFGIISSCLENYVLMVLFAYGSSFGAIGNISWTISTSGGNAEQRKKLSPYLVPAVVSLVICALSFHIVGVLNRRLKRMAESAAGRESKRKEMPPVDRGQSVVVDQRRSASGCGSGSLGTNNLEPIVE